MNGDGKNAAFSCSCSDSYFYLFIYLLLLLLKVGEEQLVLLLCLGTYPAGFSCALCLCAQPVESGGPLLGYVTSAALSRLYCVELIR